MVLARESQLPIAIPFPGITDEQFQRFCEEYTDYRVEYTADGVLLVMPPTDEETSWTNALITIQLGNWTLKTRRGITTESSGGFILPSGARRSPDAAWISKKRRGKRPSCPEFVIELISPSDRRKTVRAKMVEWLAGGAELGWMLDPRDRSVTIYRPDREPEVRIGVSGVAGEGPVEGFVLDLAGVWNPDLDD